MHKIAPGFVARLNALERDEMTRESMIEFYQEMVDTEVIDHLSESHRCRADQLIREGLVRVDDVKPSLNPLR